MKKILVVLTNNSRYGKHKEATGLWLAEATEFVDEVTKKGYQIDYLSPKGGYVPIDPRSLKPFYLRESDLALYQSEDFQSRALSQSLSPQQVRAEDYLAIYYTGGHGVVWDFPHDEALAQLAQDIYQAGGYLSSVCHGLAGLLYLKDSLGQPLIAGKTITGFTQTEEVLSGKQSLVPFGTEKVARSQGANFVKKRFFSEFAVRDGQLITGQNPMSGRAVARLLVKALAKN
ncbi:type 1 glutamine amidotransferase domain-containing protein [Streptococcus oricebi]|uniref:Type 1 glutamine amidotransferase domain-containing protein n=1 Tax=Streptococcus oricebi TaxID=1547447 RepID=A0ABS5B5I4_9STRE|nr:type 1 glutamine amidotransferase domain-containing protein [Streptococcus oricebi]MBP2623239.1 type 1 glutamine amidotransferase domain-containing protein [Streptococcus oricebi]